MATAPGSPCAWVPGREPDQSARWPTRGPRAGHVAASQASAVRVASVHQRDHRIDVVALDWIVGEAIGPLEPARLALVDDHESLAAPGVHTDRPHHAVTGRGPVAGPDVDMLGPQTRRAVVAVASIAERRDRCGAVVADESLILGSSIDGCASGSKKLIFNRSCRVPFSSHRWAAATRVRVCGQRPPGLIRARDRFTARSPSSGVGD